MDYLQHCLDIIHKRPPRTLSYGKVQSVIGLLVEASEVNAAVGELCFIYEGTHPRSRKIKAEVVGVRGNISILMPMETTVGLKAGCLVERSSIPLTVQVGDALLGRVIDANGFPIDNLGSILLDHVQRVHREPPSPMDRQLISKPLYTGIRAIDAFLTLGRGQRIGIFSGSGVGKSTLLGMIARTAKADVNVIGLIGERGREVQEFIVDNLGKEGLKRSVVVAVTGEQAAMHRVKGASITMAIAEFFPRSRKGCPFDDGFSDTCSHGATRNWSCDRRTANNSRLHAERICDASSSPRTCRPWNQRNHYRHLHRVN